MSQCGSVGVNAYLQKSHSVLCFNYSYLPLPGLNGLKSDLQIMKSLLSRVVLNMGGNA